MCKRGGERKIKKRRIDALVLHCSINSSVKREERKKRTDDLHVIYSYGEKSKISL